MSAATLLAAGALTAAAAAAAACAVLALRLRRARCLVARASHEVRGPLAAAGLALEALVRREELPAEAAWALESQLRRARLALADLEAAHRGEAAADALEPVGVAGLVAGLAAAWRPVAAARGVELRVSGVTAGATLLADRTRLAQAAGNLLANALEHGSGPVELRARATATRLRLEVRDGGPGLGAPVADLARPRGARGHGLAIAADIAARHGGRLESAPSAHGAAIVLDLPLLARSGREEVVR